jgi:hypothetical protein
MKATFFEQDIPLYTIFILILIISANFLVQIFPCKIQKSLSNNMYFKHIFSFLTLIFFVVLSAPIGDANFNLIIYKSFILYVLFIVITKTNHIFFTIIIILLGVLYLIILKLNDLNENNRKDKVKLENNLNNLYNYISYLIIILIIIGFLMYMGEKKYEYKENFEYTKFIFGIPYCRGVRTEISFLKSLKYAF